MEDVEIPRTIPEVEVVVVVHRLHSRQTYCRRLLRIRLVRVVLLLPAEMPLRGVIHRLTASLHMVEVERALEAVLRELVVLAEVY